MGSLFAPRWIVAHILVAVVAVLFISLGFWQLRRLDERQLENAVGEARYLAEPAEVRSLVVAAAQDTDSLQYRSGLAEGEYRTEDEVLIRSQVFRAEAGFHVITPLLLEDGTAVLVNRGWIPLVLDQVPVTDAPPEEDRLVVEGWIDLTEERGALSPTDPSDGRLVVLNRVDIERIQQQVPYQLLPVYLNPVTERDLGLPVTVAPPMFDDEGPHLGYAIQWFSFALIGVIGYFVLMRRAVQRSH